MLPGSEMAHETARGFSYQADFEDNLPSSTGDRLVGYISRSYPCIIDWANANFLQSTVHLTEDAMRGRLPEKGFTNFLRSCRGSAFALNFERSQNPCRSRTTTCSKMTFVRVVYCMLGLVVHNKITRGWESARSKIKRAIYL